MKTSNICDTKPKNKGIRVSSLIIKLIHSNPECSFEMEKNAKLKCGDLEPGKEAPQHINYKQVPKSIEKLKLKTQINGHKCNL